MTEQWLRRFAENLTKRMDDQERRLRGVERKPQLHKSSLHDGSVDEYEGKTLSSSWGRQHDGTHTVAHFAGPTPPQPSAADVTAGPLSLTVRWDGRFMDGVSPMDLKQVEVVVDGVNKGEVVGELGSGLVVSPLSADPHTVVLVARTQSGKPSTPSVPVVATPLPNVLTKNPDGSDTTKVSETESFLTFGEASISPEGDGTFRNLSAANDPEFMGKQLLGSIAQWNTPSPTDAWLDQLPRGILTTGQATSHNDGITDGEMGLLQLNFKTQAGRNYKVHVEPISVYVSPTPAVSNPFGYLKLRENHGDSPANPVYADGLWRQQVVRRADTGLHMFPFGGTWLYQSFADTEVRMLFSLASDGDMDIIDSVTAGDATVWVEDIGPNVRDTSMTRASYRKYNSDPEPPPPTDNPVDNHVYEEQATGTRSFKHGGAERYLFEESRIWQGQSPAGHGDLRSMVLFPDASPELAGAEITDVRVYVHFDHWWSGGGGTAHFGLHGYNSIYRDTLNSVRVDWSRSFNRGQERWMRVPQHLWGGFKDGTWRGFTMTGNSLSEYGNAYAFGSEQPRLRIEYRK